MLTVLSLALSLVASVPAHASKPAAIVHDCLVTHINEARALNNKRKGIYADWADRLGYSGFNSRLVSRILISSELFSLRDSKDIDKDAKEFQDQGIPIVCDDLRPISDAGLEPVCPKNGDPCYVLDKVTRKPKPVTAMEISERVKQKPQMDWTTQLNAAYAGDVQRLGSTSFPATLELTRGILREMNESQNERFFCIGRHLVESLIRIAALAPRYEATRIGKGLPHSTLPISRRLIESHIKLIGTTGEAIGLDGLDTRAAFFESKGIPIICNDVPPIPDPDQP